MNQKSSRNNSRSRDPTLHHSCGIGKDIDVRSLPPFAMGHGQDHWRLRRTDGKTEILRTQTTSGKERSYIVFWARKVLIPTVQTCIIHILNRLAAILLTRVTRGFACPFRHQELKGSKWKYCDRPKIENRNGASEKNFFLYTFTQNHFPNKCLCVRLRFSWQGSHKVNMRYYGRRPCKLDCDFELSVKLELEPKLIIRLELKLIIKLRLKLQTKPQFELEKYRILRCWELIKITVFVLEPNSAVAKGGRAFILEVSSATKVLAKRGCRSWPDKHFLFSEFFYEIENYGRNLYF
ncbi:unnamed protein product, partial [Nesidiocoris tenuis]